MHISTDLMVVHCCCYFWISLETKWFTSRASKICFINEFTSPPFFSLSLSGFRIPRQKNLIVYSFRWFNAFAWCIYMKESVSDGLEKKRANNNCVCVSVWRNKFDSSAVFLFGHTNDPERMWPKRWKYLNHRCYIWPFQHDVPLIRIGECCIGPCFIHSRFDLIRVKFVAFEPEKNRHSVRWRNADASQ